MAQTKSNNRVTGSAGTAAAATDASGAATVPAATEFAPSGAPVQAVPDVDPSHPAIDDNPRKGTTVDQNRIDLNDPTKTGAEAVAENLRDQGKGVEAEAEPTKSDNK